MIIRRHVSNYSYEHQSNGMTPRQWLIKRAGYTLGINYSTDANAETELTGALEICRDVYAARPVFAYYYRLSEQSIAKLIKEIEAEAEMVKEQDQQRMQSNLHSAIREAQRGIEKARYSFANPDEPVWYTKTQEFRTVDADALALVAQAVELLKQAEALVTAK